MLNDILTSRICMQHPLPVQLFKECSLLERSIANHWKNPKVNFLFPNVKSVKILLKQTFIVIWRFGRKRGSRENFFFLLRNIPELVSIKWANKASRAILKRYWRLLGRKGADDRVTWILQNLFHYACNLKADFRPSNILSFFFLTNPSGETNAGFTRRHFYTCSRCPALEFVLTKILFASKFSFLSFPQSPLCLWNLRRIKKKPQSSAIWHASHRVNLNRY